VSSFRFLQKAKSPHSKGRVSLEIWKYYPQAQRTLKGIDAIKLDCLKICLCSKFKMSTSTSSRFCHAFSAISGLIIVQPAPAFLLEICSRGEHVYMRVYTFRFSLLCVRDAAETRHWLTSFQAERQNCLRMHVFVCSSSDDGS
jgi:hypothetical protein